MSSPLLRKLHAAMYSSWFVPVALLALCFTVLGDVLAGIRRGVISASTGDIAYYFIYSRQYGFSHLHAGHVPQWDPHIFSGVPFFGCWQAALLYPLNWLYLFMPLHTALAADITISTFLTGLFTAMLASKYTSHPLSRIVAGAIAMFCGAFFSHVWPGHLSELAAMAWSPLILLAADSILDRPNRRSILIGIAALAMQIFAGHPQTVFNTAITVAVYALIRTISATRRPTIAVSLAGMAVGGVLLAAAQLLAGIQVSSESVRSSTASYDFTAQFSFPPENILTLLAPHFFGNLRSIPYWGRSYYWEATAFVGLSTLVLAVAGFISGTSQRRRLWLTMILVLFAVALGKHTPCLYVLYRCVPGFAAFRSPNRFAYEATLFSALLASTGLDAILAGSRVCRSVLRTAWGIAAAACLCAIMAHNPGAMNFLVAARNSNDPGAILHLTALSSPAEQLAQTSLVAAAVAATLIAVITSLCLHCRRWGYALAFVALIELSGFARSMVTTFDANVSYPAVLRQWYRSNPGNFRVVQRGHPPNSAIGLGAYDIWGYDPVAQYRYVEFLTASQGRDINNPSIDILLDYWSNAFSLLGCRYVVIEYAGGELAYPIAHACPLAAVVYDYDIMPSRQLMFQTLLGRSFDPNKTVLLESSPGIVPAQPATPPLVNFKWLDTDSMQVEAITKTPGVLLLNQSYSRFWRATALPESTQQSYTILPGDYTQIAIPVRAGRHKLTLRYQPSLFPIGAAITSISLIAYLATCLFEWRRRPENPTTHATH